MAGKEATVYIIDQGVSMGDCHNGRAESDLDYGMQYVWDKMAATMATGLKGLSTGVIGFRTDETNNMLSSDDDSYENISVMRPLGPMEIDHLQDLRQNIKPSNTNDGDAISAIVVAIDRIVEFTTLKSGKQGKFTRKIVLLTDGQGPMDGEDIQSIADRINEFEIQLVVIGIDFDSEDPEFTEDDKSDIKRQNEELLKRFTEKCNDAVFGTAAEAIEALSVPQIKVTKAYKTFEGRLQLGDFIKYPESAMSIDVMRYFKTKSAKPVSASSFVTRTAIGNGEGSAQSSHTIPDIQIPGTGDDLSAVKNARTYKVNDASAPGGKKDVERDELAKGYEYGRTAVHISESDENVTKLETFQSLTIIGFIPSDKYEKYLNMGESCITIAQTVSDKAKMALSSLIHALHELESYAVARIVPKDGKDPQIILMAPSIEPDMEALIDVPLPFAEDVRVYRFPPLDRVITTSGAPLTQHRNLPTKDLMDAMSDYVDSMDLSTLGRDDEGEPAEYMPFDETFSPNVHRINQAIRLRAIHPESPIADPAAVLTKWSHPPAELVSDAASLLDRLATAANVKKVPPKVKGKRSRTEPIKPLSGLDVGMLLSREKRQKISPDNAVPEFKQMLENTTDEGTIPEAMKQMGTITRSYISGSLGDSKYDMAIRNVREMRERMIGLETPELYNAFIRDLKTRVAKQDGLGGNRRDFWFKIRNSKLGLIDMSQSEVSDVSEEEAIEFYSLKTELPDRSREE